MDKMKRQARFLQKARSIQRQYQLRKAIYHTDAATDKQTKQPHRMAKLSFQTCGSSTCVMCGNPRKFFGDLTIQEQKQIERMHYEMKETYENE